MVVEWWQLSALGAGFWAARVPRPSSVPGSAPDRAVLSLLLAFPVTLTTVLFLLNLLAHRAGRSCDGQGRVGLQCPRAPGTPHDRGTAQGGSSAVPPSAQFGGALAGDLICQCP